MTPFPAVSSHFANQSDVNIQTERMTIYRGLYMNYRICAVYVEKLLVGVFHVDLKNAYRPIFPIPTVDANRRTQVTQDRHKSGTGIPAGVRTTYDPAGRVVRTERLANVIIDIIDDGTTLKSQFVSADHVISSTTSTYDKAGRVIKSVDASGAITRYEYDAAGRTLAVIDHLNNRTEYEYDKAGRQTQGSGA